MRNCLISLVALLALGTLAFVGCQALVSSNQRSARIDAIAAARRNAEQTRRTLTGDPATGSADPRQAAQAATRLLRPGALIGVRQLGDGFEVDAYFDENWDELNQWHRVRLCVTYLKSSSPGSVIEMRDLPCPPDPTFNPTLDEFVKPGEN